MFALVPYRSGGTRPMTARDWNLAPAGGKEALLAFSKVSIVSKSESWRVLKKSNPLNINIF